MKIIRASRTHSEIIVKLNFYVQKMHNRAHPDVFKPYSSGEEIKLYFEKELDDQSNYIFLAYLSDIPVGYLWAQIQKIPDTPFNYSANRIYIHHICVDEKYRRKGVGSRLMDHVKKMSRDYDISGIDVDAWTFNQEAARFFQSQGFDTYNCKMWLNPDYSF